MKNGFSVWLVIGMLGSLLPTSVFGSGPLQPTDFIKATDLEKDLKAFCLKMPVQDAPVRLSTIRSSTTYSRDLQFEFISFEMSKPGAEGPPDCRAVRDMVQVVSNQNKKSILFDSKFYPDAYCESPSQILQAPIVYKMTSIGEAKETTRKLAVLEYASSTLLCPDLELNRYRRFLFFDLEDSNKLLLDIQADYVVPEAGNEPYRLDLIGVSQVFKSLEKKPAEELPDSIEFKKGSFSVTWRTPRKKTQLSSKLSSPTLPSGQFKLNSIYSKDSKYVYYKLVDEAGKINGADPKTFQLLSEGGESAYTKDQKNVYYYGKKIPTASAESFVAVNDRYGKDIHSVYFTDSVLKEADVSSFSAPFAQVYFAKDKNHVFSGRRIIKGADPLTFSAGEDRSCGVQCIYRSEDKNYRYGVHDEIVQKTVPANSP